MNITRQIHVKTVYVGFNGREFETKELARLSFVREDLGKILMGDQVHYEFESGTAADALIANADLVIELLNAARGK